MEFHLGSESALRSAVKHLDVAMISQVLDGANDNQSCTCPSDWGRDRCQHNFTWKQVRTFRGSWLQSKDPLMEEVRRLRARQSKSSSHVEYFLGNVRVCRGFYQACFGISKRKMDAITQQVRGKPNAYQLVRLECPANSIPSGPSQLQICINFWDQFFGDQCQTSGGTYRYFPVNMSCYYIYHHDAWAWWKDVVEGT